MEVVLQFKIIAVVAAFGLAQAHPARASCQITETGVQVTQDLGQWLNDLRRDRGLGALRVSAKLAATAQGHACDMAARDALSHLSTGGGTLRDRLRVQGYRLRTAVENIASSGRGSAAEVAARIWLASPAHKDNLLTPGLTEFGFGMAVGNGKTYYVFVGGKPR